MIAALAFYVFALYALLGVGVALPFVCVGITRVLSQSATVTIPARLLILPGAVALWPVVARRWVQSVRGEAAA